MHPFFLSLSPLRAIALCPHIQRSTLLGGNPYSGAYPTESCLYRGLLCGLITNINANIIIVFRLPALYRKASVLTAL